MATKTHRSKKGTEVLCTHGVTQGRSAFFLCGVRPWRLRIVNWKTRY
jgi:hypothetical protein